MLSVRRAAVLLVLPCALASCGAPAPAPHAEGPATPPSAAPSTSAAAAPSGSASAAPSASAVASAEPAATSSPYRHEIVIHQADIFGQLVGHAGKTVMISSNLTTSSTPPEIGNKGSLFQSLDDAAAENWVLIAEIEIKTKLDKHGQISATITSEKKDYPAGKKFSPFSPRAHYRLQWEWQ